MKYLILLMTLFFSFGANAADKYDFEKLKKHVEKHDNKENSLELTNGRAYKLDDSLIIETINSETLGLTTNIFDLENGIFIQDYKAEKLETESKTDCEEKTLIPFRNMTEKRIDEITEIGCLIYDYKNRLVRSNDDLYIFYQKHCQVNE